MNNCKTGGKVMRFISVRLIVFLFPLIIAVNGYCQTDYLEHRLNQFNSVRNIYNEGIQLTFITLKDYLSPDHFNKLVNTNLYISFEDNIISATAYGYSNSIQISAATILFIEELATTLAWYEYNGNTNFQPILNYVLFLRKNMNKLEKEITPSMYEVLGIPASEIWARDNDDPTKEFAQNFLKSAVTWIIAHEMGHIALGHLDHQIEFTNHLEKAIYNRELEMAADEFAIRLMGRVRLAPIGMIISINYYSLLYPIRLEFRYEEDWQTYLANESHPVWPERLEGLADLFRQYGRNFFITPGQIEFSAKSLEDLAMVLNSEDVLDAMILGSENLTLEDIMTFEPLKNIDEKYYLPWYKR